MCGHAGFARLNKKTPPTLAGYSVFVHLLVLSQLRGFDSSGIAALWKQMKTGGRKKTIRRGWMIAKDLDAPFTVWKKLHSLITRTHYVGNNKQAYSSPATFCAIAHSRAATLGSVTEYNAHPFSFGNNRFVGAHNGTIHNAESVYEKLKDTTPLPNTTEPPVDFLDKNMSVTDSEIVLYCIYRWGIDEVLPLIEGAWAFVWFDATAGTMNFLRNYARDLFYYPSYTKDMLYWTSEKAMMEFSVKREGGYNSGWNSADCKLFEVNNHYSFDIINPPALKFKDTDMPWAEVRNLNSLRYKNLGSAGSGSAYANEDWWDDELGWGEPTKKEGKKGGSIIYVKYSHIQGKAIPAEDWHKEQRDLHGPAQEEPESLHNHKDDTICIWCSEPLSTRVPELSLEIKHSGTVCGVCADDIETVEKVIEYYPMAGDDNAWIQRYLDLEDEVTKVVS